MKINQLWKNAAVHNIAKVISKVCRALQFLAPYHMMYLADAIYVNTLPEE